MIDTFEPYYYSGKTFVMGEWLKDAKKLNDKAVAQGQIVLDPIPEKILNCRFLIGWLQRAIVLSYYYLLRHESYVKNNEKQEKQDNLYFDAMR